jgi:hypothetical protein
MVLAIPMFDDRALRLLTPVRAPAASPPAMVHKIAVAALAAVVCWLSINPVRNMLSPGQIMNTAYNSLHLVGTYGAFGSITRERYKVIVEGTEDAPGPAAKWREYGFKGKPGFTWRAPPQIAPYHLRLDWLMWFAAMSDYTQHTWFAPFMLKLLQGDRATLGLLQSNPFPEHPPRYVRASLYRYRFTTPEEHRRTGEWWKREFIGPYFPSVTLGARR